MNRLNNTRGDALSGLTLENGGNRIALLLKAVRWILSRLDNQIPCFTLFCELIEDQNLKNLTCQGNDKTI